jgi:REP element-mobilizing transposase RayT
LRRRGAEQTDMNPPIRITRNRIIIAHHLVLMGYGHWYPNDIRGSGSDEIRKDLLKQLGDIHPGRKPVQPTRTELKAFHRAGEPMLEQSVLWFDEASRQAIADGFALATQEQGYSVYACAVLRNHAHLVVKRHKHPHDVMWRTFAEYARQSLASSRSLPVQHRVWGNRPYSKFLYTPDDIRGRIQYVNDNPVKEGLPEQGWEFVKNQSLQP